MQRRIDDVISYKDFLKIFATDEETIAKINSLADDNCFIHGDFHLENVASSFMARFKTASGSPSLLA